MTDTRITRRRVVQGAGAVGIAGVFGSSIVAAQQNETAQDGQSAALRVAHASPDAPSIDVRIDGESQIDGIEFGNLSTYTQVEPGSHRVTIVATQEGLLGGLFDDILGGGQEGTALFDQQIEIEQGTTYTLVAFGEVARGPAAGDGGPAGNETGGIGDNETDGLGQNETGGAGTDAGAEVVAESLAFGDHESFVIGEGDYTFLFRETVGGTPTGISPDVPVGDTQAGGQNDTGGVGDNETDGFDTNETNGVGGGTQPGGTTGSSRAFQVEVLEDDLSDPGEGQARVRVFHAVPDVDSVSVTAVSQEELADQNQTNQTGTGPNQTDGGPGANDTGGFGDNDSGGLGDNDTGGGLGGNQTGGEVGGTGENVREADVSLNGGTVYSGFAMGYFNPEAAAAAEGNQTEGNESGGLFGGNQTGDNETAGGQPDDNQTGGNQTDGGDDLVQDVSGAEFEFVVVEDAQGGERSDGGTGGLL